MFFTAFPKDKSNNWGFSGSVKTFQARCMLS